MCPDIAHSPSPRSQGGLTYSKLDLSKHDIQEHEAPQGLEGPEALMDGEEKEKYDKARCQFRRASRRYSLVNVIGKRLVEPRLPGFLQVFNNIKPLILSLTSLPIIRAFRAFKFFSRLQKVCYNPYLPDLSTGRQLTKKTDAVLIKRMNRYCLYAVGVYDSDDLERNGFRISKDAPPTSLITRKLRAVLVSKRDIVQPQRPAWFLFSDSVHKELVLAIQGSNHANDWLTNLLCLPSFTGSHEGMSDAASNLDSELRLHVTDFLDAHPTYRFVITGHSLGGGVGSLLLIRWHKEGTSLAASHVARMEAWSFGAPCCCVPEIGNAFKDKIYSVTFGRDIVSRLSYGSTRDLLLTLHGLVYTMTRAGKKEIKKRLQALKEEDNSGEEVRDLLLKEKYCDENQSSLSVASTEDWDEVSSDGSGSDLDAEEQGKAVIDGETSQQRDLVVQDNLFGSSYLAPYRRKQEGVDELALDVSRVQIHLPLPFRELSKIIKARSAEIDRHELQYIPEAERKRSFLLRVYDCCVHGNESPTAPMGSEKRHGEDQLLEQTLRTIQAAAISPREQMMTPAGTWLIIIPRRDFLQQGRECYSKSFNPGNCSVFEVPPEVTWSIVKEPAWCMKALADHSCANYAQCCIPDHLRRALHVTVVLDEAPTNL